MRLEAGTWNREAQAALLARGARREEEARARLVAADFGTIRGEALALAERPGDATEAPGRATLFADLLEAARASDDAPAEARLADALDREIERLVGQLDRRTPPHALRALARCLATLGGERHSSRARRLAAALRASLAGASGPEAPTAMAARVSCLGQAAAGGTDLAERFEEGVRCLLSSQDTNGGWSDPGEGGDATARVLDDALALALLRDPAGGGAIAVAAAGARALARLASTQSPSGDWRGDLPATIATLRAAILLLPALESRHPDALAAAAWPAGSRDGRFVERGFAWCLSRKPDLGWGEPEAPVAEGRAALARAVAGIALVREHGAFRSGDPLAPARARGLA